MRFILLPDISCCIFDELPWWNGCVPMLLVGISTFAQGDVGFSMGIWVERGGSGGVIPLRLSGGTPFLGRHTGLSPCQVLQFCPNLTFAMCFTMAALQSCVWELTCYALCRQSLNQNPPIYHCRQSCLGWLRTFCPDKLISSLVFQSLHSLTVD